MSSTCTCPSGDGSLRHPCPSHPPVCAEIKPDTSLYTDIPSRLRATALVAEAHAAGKAVQCKGVFTAKPEWMDIHMPTFATCNVTDYRIKPEPREWWLNVYPDGESFSYDSKEQADAKRRALGRTVKVREVLD